MITILLFIMSVGFCEAWLDEYFNESNEIVKKESVKILEKCSVAADKWEEAVRLRKIDDGICSENKLFEKCLPKNSNQSVVFEYIKHLVQDSKKLCHESFNEAVASQVTLLKNNSSEICAEILKEKSHTTCGIVIVLSFIFSASCLMCDIFRVQKYARRFLKKKREGPEQPCEPSYAKCEEGIDVIEV